MLTTKEKKELKSLLKKKTKTNEQAIAKHKRIIQIVGKDILLSFYDSLTKMEVLSKSSRIIKDLSLSKKKGITGEIKSFKGLSNNIRKMNHRIERLIATSKVVK